MDEIEEERQKKGICPVCGAKMGTHEACDGCDILIGEGHIYSIRMVFPGEEKDPRHLVCGACHEEAKRIGVNYKNYRELGHSSILPERDDD